MSSDNQDKTVFRQPVNRGDGGVVRPVPGGRVAPTPRVPNVTPHQQPVYTPTAVSTESFKLGHGLNPLVNCASTLLAVFCKTRETLNHSNVSSLHKQLEEEIKAFDIEARNLGIKSETVLSARYILCTILDEAVLNTPWGADSSWTQRTLLSLFHNETAGGEKFYVLLDRMRQSSNENMDFIELCYLCLSLGYEGKYKVQNRGRDSVESIRDDLFQLIRNFRGDYERSLSANWQGVGNSKSTLTTHLPIWVFASILVGLMALTYSGLRFWLDETTSNVTSELKMIIYTNDETTPSND